MKLIGAGRPQKDKTTYMKTMLTLRPAARVGSGPDLRNWDKIFQYEVEGLPPGQEAWIAEIDFRWQILRVKDGLQEGWTGSYKSAEEALAALESVTRANRDGSRDGSTVNIRPLDKSLIRRRQRNGHLFDVIEYPFLVSDDRVSSTVWVGITGACHDLATALGSKKLSQDDLVQAANAWLRSRVEKRECDPFSGPASDMTIDLPPGVTDYWTEYREIPHWL